MEISREIPEDIQKWIDKEADERLYFEGADRLFELGAIDMYRKMIKVLEKQNVAILRHLSQKQELQAELATLKKERDDYRKALSAIQDRFFEHFSNN